MGGMRLAGGGMASASAVAFLMVGSRSWRRLFISSRLSLGAFSAAVCAYKQPAWRSTTYTLDRQPLSLITTQYELQRGSCHASSFIQAG